MSPSDLLLGFAWPTAADIINALPVIISLIIIEGLLSVDNALGIAAMANHLPGEQKQKALRWGIIGAYVFRGLALAFASVMSIEIMDLSLSVDNVVAAVALSPDFWVVCTGVFIGILALRLVAGVCIPLIQKFPILEPTAFVLIGYVGLILVFELTTHLDVTTWQKFIGIVLIIAAAITYAKNPSLHRPLAPVLRLARGPMWLVSATVGLALALVTWPVRAVWHLARREPVKSPFSH